MTLKTNLFINNQEVETNEYTELRDPGRLSDIVGLIAKGTLQHVDQAVNAAHQAFRSWALTPLDERISLVLKVANRLEAEANSIARIVSKENGMLLTATRIEIGMAVSGIRNAAELARNFFMPKVLEDETGWVSIEKKPMGVIAGIVPWNAPVVLTMQKLAPALIAGNTMVFKPSPFAPMGVTEILKLAAEFFPPGVINVVHGEGDVGAALTTHPLVRKISFTGGGATAKHIMKAAADTLKGIHFELGGNDAAIILNDANLEEVVPKIVTAVFRRSGQFCYAIKRIYAPEEMYDHIFEKMVDLTKEYKIGHQLDERATMGPINNRQQFQNVRDLIERIKNSSAKIVELGTKLDPDNWENGYYLRPILVRDVDPNHDIVTCEQFGPIIPLVSFRTEEEVIEMVNNSELGLGSSVWSSDFERSLKIARNIEAGMTFINGAGQTPLGHKYIPFGGVKQSGIGRENSEMIFDEYTETHGINYHKTNV
ncbi:aldehyde dehydrogenase family protein [Bacillus sp. FJAT-29814]|uniref:aldehyde dehydrogenase family protein n=1 Tax=Bacillus sp. FJAT-29814 TaxID=1729688 RepID=UPI0020A51C51|nr:aldehyde dehydrogenase family protein [Bacillus sp. FJAT-29814]